MRCTRRAVSSALGAAGRCDRRLRQGPAGTRGDPRRRRPARIFASTAPRSVARRIVTAAAPRSMPRSPCTSPSRPRIRIRRSPITMEGYYGPMPSSLIPYFWAPAWNSVRAVNKFQDEVGGPLRGGDPGIRLIEPTSGTAPRYFDERAGSLRDAGRRVADRAAARDIRQRGTEPPGARCGRARPAALSRPQRSRCGRIDVAEGAMVAVEPGRGRVAPAGQSAAGFAARVSPGWLSGCRGSIGTLLPAWGKLTWRPAAPTRRGRPS